MKAVAYCRVSTNKDDQLNSLEMQKKFFEEYARTYNFELVKIYADEGISGTKVKNRREFLAMLNDAKNKNFDIVVVKDVSRLARNTVDFLESIRKLKSYNIDTQFISSNMKVLGDSEFILTIFAALAQEESANISKRIKFGKNYNAQKGRVPNIVYGYDKIKGDYFNLKINSFEAEVIRRIFSLYTYKGDGASKIANTLNNEQIKTKRGFKWTQNSIIRILNNEIYIGKVINKKQEIKDFLTGTRENLDKNDWLITKKDELAIIDEMDFYNAQHILSQRQKQFNTNNFKYSNKYPLSTLIKCNECGRSFRRFIYKNNNVKWKCSNLKICNNKFIINEDEIMLSIQNYVLNILYKDENCFNNIKFEVKKNINIFENIDKNETKRNLSELNHKKEKNIELYYNEVLNINELKISNNLINEKINLYQNKLYLITKKEELINNTFFDIEYLNKCFFSSVVLKNIIDKITIIPFTPLPFFTNNIIYGGVHGIFPLCVKKKLFFLTKLSR